VHEDSFWNAICALVDIFVWKDNCALCGQSYLYAICALILIFVCYLCIDTYVGTMPKQAAWVTNDMVPTFYGSCLAATLHVDYTLQICTWIIPLQNSYNKFWNISKLTQNEQFLQHLHHNFLMLNATSSLM
jgi:hypothetical protein